MMGAFWSTRRLGRLAMVLTLVLGVIALARLSIATEAQAQSSVRPPAGATVNVAPSPGLPRSNVPSRASQPVDVKKGHVPGEALGNQSDSEMWRAVRQGISGTVSIPDKQAGQLVQSEGDNWRAYRNGPLATWGVLSLVAMLLLMVLFLLARGRVAIDDGRAGTTITRFKDPERMGHWLIAVSFIILALTGLNITYGKYVLLPILGAPAFATLTQAGKWLHNYVAFSFMAGLVLVSMLWIKDNFPNAYDLKWIAKGGGLFTKGVHPPSKKFNAGQKFIFWSVLLGGIGLSLTGISLLFPSQVPLFSYIFAALGAIGFDVPTMLTPVQEGQYATTWHTIISTAMIVVIFGHIYIGTIGMEGAFDAMGSGDVDLNWAKQHHSIWVEEEMSAAKQPPAEATGPKVAPAE